MWLIDPKLKQTINKRVRILSAETEELDSLVIFLIHISDGTLPSECDIDKIATRIPYDFFQTEDIKDLSTGAFQISKMILVLVIKLV